MLPDLYRIVYIHDVGYDIHKDGLIANHNIMYI